MDAEAKQELFWDLADEMVAAGDAEKGTLMGFPCLRAGGAFFAMADHRRGSLVVKLPARRVDELIETRVGEPFAPAGKVFKEWVLVDNANEPSWRAYLAEARAFVVQ